jgi:hypothetical protein
MDIIQALRQLAPGAQWTMNADDYDQLTWLSPDIPKPSKEEVEAKIEELKIEWQNTEYQRLRGPEYPDLKELADALYWSSKGDNTKLDQYYDKCEAIKIKYPKP